MTQNKGASPRVRSYPGIISLSAGPYGGFHDCSRYGVPPKHGSASCDELISKRRLMPVSVRYGRFWHVAPGLAYFQSTTSIWDAISKLLGHHGRWRRARSPLGVDHDRALEIRQWIMHSLVGRKFETQKHRDTVCVGTGRQRLS